MDNTEYESRISAMNIWADSVRKELANHICSNLHEVIYHYTDINGLIGIISSGCIWATHASRLNDSSENKLGFELVTNYVKDNIPTALKPLIDKVLLEIKSTETYVSCYSTEGNLLSQWRNYTGEKVGYSLGLETKHMATIDASMPLLEQVTYNNQEAVELIDILLIRTEEYLNNNTFGEVEVGYLLGLLQATLANIACVVKHNKFSEEHEYRHIYQPENTKLQLTKSFRNGLFGLTPYVEIEFRKGNKLPLKTVTIGPCQDFKQEEDSLLLLLAKYGYENIEIIESGIPLRI